jgi:hypothetical protein
MKRNTNLYGKYNKTVLIILKENVNQIGEPEKCVTSIAIDRLVSVIGAYMVRIGFLLLLTPVQRQPH